MPNVSSFGAQTDNAVVSGTVTDRQMVIPEVPPQGLMSIGPRQSPNYIKEPWNAQTSYVFYDVVKDGAGASYVATKPVVPAGTALTNEDYWFKWADPNAQINELNEVVKTFNERIAQNASAITAEVARATAAEQAEEQRATAAEATKAPVNHATEETIYGVGNDLNYGHVKLSVNDTPVKSGSKDGIATTPSYVNSMIEQFNAVEFGIDNTGETEVSDKVQNFLKFCTSKSKVAFFPKGTYYIEKTITIPQDCKIIGFSAFTTVFKVKDNTVAFTQESNKYAQGVVLANFSLKNDVAQGTYRYKRNDSSIGIKIAATGCLIENVLVFDFGIGIQTTNVPNPDSGYEIYVVNGESHKIANAWCVRCYRGMDLLGNDWFYENLIAGGCCYGIKIGSGASLNGCHIWACNGPSLTLTLHSYCSNVEIESMEFHTNDDNQMPIAINATDDGLLIENVLIWNINNDGTYPLIKCGNAKINIANMSIIAKEGNTTLPGTFEIDEVSNVKVTNAVIDPKVTSSNKQAVFVNRKCYIDAVQFTSPGLNEKWISHFTGNPKRTSYEDMN